MHGNYLEQCEIVLPNPALLMLKARNRADGSMYYIRGKPIDRDQ
jgi:hypothetical protein